MAVFSVSAWFYVDIDVSGDPESDEYQQAVDEIIDDLALSNASLFTHFDDYTTDNIEIELMP